MNKPLSAAVNARTVNLDDGLIAPYGGRLVQAFVPATERQALHKEIKDLAQVELSLAELRDLEMLACGAYSPLSGFMNQATYRSVCDRWKLPEGLAWGMPITLGVTQEVARTLKPGTKVALVHLANQVAEMTVEDVYPWDPAEEAQAVWGDDGHNHPDMAARKQRGVAYLVGGPIAFLAVRMAPYLQSKHLWPRETRGSLTLHGWRKMAAFHMRHPWQRAQEYLLKCALEASDGLLLHVDNDVGSESHTPADKVIMEASQLLLQNYFPDIRVLANPLPDKFLGNDMRAVLQHAIISQNYGCDSIFFTCGTGSEEEKRSMAGMQAMLQEAAESGLAITPVYLKAAFHCEACGGVATEKSCPHDVSQRIFLSEDDIHEKLITGESLPTLVTRPDIARALSRGVSMTLDANNVVKGGRHIFPHVGEVSSELRQMISGHKAAVLWMTGLSGSGKSTIAHRLERELLLSGHRVFVLDGDTLRHGLNKDLAFSEEARRENLRRAGEVAKVMLEAGMLVIASFISPFRAEREMVRKICGDRFFELYVEASLEDCEARDPKGLYKRARAGLIPQFTGISSPYEQPEQPELLLNTTVESLDACVKRSMDFMVDKGILRISSTERSRTRRQVGVDTADSLAGGNKLLMQ
jgi:sulfate adenylyltransferase